MSESMEDLSQDLEMSARPDLKEMVSAEAVSAPASKSITQEVKAAEQQTQKADIESESRAAAFGGVTSYFEMPNTIPQTTTLEGRALRIAADLLAATGLCLHEERGICAKWRKNEGHCGCENCILRWLKRKAREELKG